MPRLFYYLMLCLFVQVHVQAQPACVSPGQTPNSAIILCGNGTYSKNPTTYCFNGSFYLPGCTNENTSYGDLNPVYYKFTCKSAGTFGFLIAAWKPEEDFNWQLFDITGKRPGDIFTNLTLTVAANFSGEPGITGATKDGASLIQCRTHAGQGSPLNTYSRMPQLQENHTYLLMVGSAGGAGAFALTVGGGTADISGDIAVPLRAETASCTSNQLTIAFSKQVKCNSITPGGTEFILQPSLAAVSSATGINCSETNTADSLLLQFSNPLPAGSYTLIIKNGTDGNTIQDNCSNLIPQNTELKFTISPYPIIDSVLITSCKPRKLRLLLSKQTNCNSIAADGSDFRITGPSSVQIIAASQSCNNGFTNEIELTLDEGITISGAYSIRIEQGTDGNSLTDACLNTSITGTSRSFSIKELVDAEFDITISKGCTADTLTFNHPGIGEVNTWSWTFGNGASSSVQNPVLLFYEGGNQTVSLFVSNGQCNANSQKLIVLDEKLKAKFSIPAAACSNERVLIENKSSAAATYTWDFGNGITNTSPNPPEQTYTAANGDKNYTVSLTVAKGSCTSFMSQAILIKSSCLILMPNAFTPNNDGLNDLFGPSGSYGVRDLRFQVFNRYGQQVFQSGAGTLLWNGFWNGSRQAQGMYTWLLQYTEPLSKKKTVQRGTVLLLY